MKIDYKNKKWDKQLANLNKVVKDLNGKLSGEININSAYKNLIENREPSKQNYSAYLKSCQRNYASAAGSRYMLDNNDFRAVDYTYLSGLTGVLASELMGENLDDKNMDLQEAIYELIATDHTQISQLREENGIISCVFNQNYEKAKELLGNIQADEEVIEGSYYKDFSALKKIYMAIIEKNEKAFNEELQKRIKRYRRNIEIPGLFFNDNYKVNKEQVKFNCMDDVLEVLKKQGFNLLSLYQ